MSTENKLYWKFDLSTFRLIGRELITDRITAIYELVKNCYDANATKVDLYFNNVGSQSKGSNATIMISDNGTGMTLDDVTKKWMVIGTASKRREEYSDPPFNRKFVGEKGIGRFAVDRIGSKFDLITKTKKDVKKLIVKIDWENYSEKINVKNDQTKLFTDIANSYSSKKAEDGFISGTKIHIKSIEEKWSDLDLESLERQLEKLISPFHKLDPPFEIFIHSNEYKKFEKKKVTPSTANYSSNEYALSYDFEKKVQEKLKFIKESGTIVIDKEPIRSFGPIKMKIYYFNEYAKRKYNKAYKNVETRIDGIRIYRDGIITTPFAEFESDRDKQRDILGIDKRLWSGAFDKIGTREVIGYVDITKKTNKNIIDATNRQDFVDTKEYRELKSFIIEQLDVISELKKHKRQIKNNKNDIKLDKAVEEIKQLLSSIKEIQHKNPDLKDSFKPLNKVIKNLDKSLKASRKQQKLERKEHKNKENIYLSLMSLQDYAIHMSHAVRTSLGKIKRMAEFFNDRFPNEKYESLFIEYSQTIYDEMKSLERVIDFMLSYAGSNVDMEDFDIKEVLSSLLKKEYAPVFNAEDISLELRIEDSYLIYANKKYFEDIFENLISNSIKALRNNEHKFIKCSGFINDKNEFVIYFSDNGEGLVEGQEERIFDIFHTNTAELGGAGIGLYIVKTRIESLNGSVKVVTSEFNPDGVTFKIKLPINNKK